MKLVMALALKFKRPPLTSWLINIEGLCPTLGVTFGLVKVGYFRTFMSEYGT